MAPEPDFAAWLDRRDAKALGRVFDATGGKLLLLLATHLAGGGANAVGVVMPPEGWTWDLPAGQW